MLSFIQLYRKLGEKIINEEWEYFQKYARQFPTNPPERCYGILIMNSETKNENMIYSSGPMELRILHLNKISELGINEGHTQRIFLDKLEEMEGRR